VKATDELDGEEPIAIWLAVDGLQPNPDQPRKTVEPERLEQLTASIRARGRVIEPLVARPVGDGRHEIVCGERRWRAAKAAGLSHVPVVVRALSDQEAFEESLAENLDREDMAPSDEVRAVARLAAEYGVQEAARRLGKPHHWVSKRKRIAEAPGFVQEFLASGASTDIEGLYELSKLADNDAAAAETVIAAHGREGRLREQVKVAARAERRDGGEDDDGEDAPPDEGSTTRHHESEASGLGEESFRLEDRSTGAGDDDQEEEEDEDADAGDDGEKEPSWLPSDAPELDEPFDARPAVLVTAVEARRAGHLVFTTPDGSVSYELTPQARDQLLALLR
jgi:ParB/RepB/Spo0J family partition protein